ncbi:MAG: hypothetical protein ABWZ25_14295 [Chitinophagaceae bacterium]
MLKNFNKYLLTNYPLLWNTRVVQVLASCLVIHILFFIAGFSSIRVSIIQKFYSVENTGGGTLYTLSILMSLGVIILWLLHYLRNNAFKQFYITDRFYLSKQFVIVFISLYVSLGFFHSFHWGVMAKTRVITDNRELVQEANTINLAMHFIPFAKRDYFKLRVCNPEKNDLFSYEDGHDYYDSSLPDFNSHNNIIIRDALDDSDAFAYQNYCDVAIDLDGFAGYRNTEAQALIADRWIRDHQEDSIRYIISQSVEVAKKYGIPFRIHPDVLAKLVFADKNGNVTRTIASSDPDQRQYGIESTNAHPPGSDFFNYSELRSVLNFIQNSYFKGHRIAEEFDFQVFFCYIALCFAILLISYRLLSRKVFLFSIIGTVVWSILFGLIASGTNANTVSYTMLIICFGSLGLSFANNTAGKLFRGVLLNWHVWMMPFVVLMITQLFRSYYSHLYPWNLQSGSSVAAVELFQATHPISTWVYNHDELLMKLNLLFVFLYVSFVFTRLAKRWHISPEE